MSATAERWVARASRACVAARRRPPPEKWLRAPSRVRGRPVLSSGFAQSFFAPALIQSPMALMSAAGSGVVPGLGMRLPQPGMVAAPAETFT